MKLLFDENLSPKLVQLLAGDFPGSVHVHDIGLGGADDKTLWRHAADNGFMIVSKGSDFHGWSTLYGFPPKIIWLWTGNCSTEKIAILPLEYYEAQKAKKIIEFSEARKDNLVQGQQASPRASRGICRHQPGRRGLGN